MAASVHPVAPPSEATSRLFSDHVAVISAGSWFSAVSSGEFAAVVAEAHEAGADELVLDLTHVRAVDAAGTATLGALAEQLDVVGCELAVAATHPGLVAWLESVPLDVELPVHETVEDALADVLMRPA